MLSIARDAGGISRADLMSLTRTLFGWKRMGSEIESRLSTVIDQLISEDCLLGNSERLRYVGE